MESVVSELEGSLLTKRDTFSYFMLLAFDSSGIIRFALLLLLWPVIWLLDVCGNEDVGLKLAIFVATVGLRATQIESVARTVLTKFYYDDIDMEAWSVFSSYEKRVVVTKTPRVMVEMFLKKHLQVDQVIGSELLVNRFGFATGFVQGGLGSINNRVADLFGDEQPCLGMGRLETICSSFLSLCKEQVHPPFTTDNKNHNHQLNRPLPVIFHDGRLVKRPTPSTALLILLWFPLGFLLAVIRILGGIVLPFSIIPYMLPLSGTKILVKGKPTPRLSGTHSGVLFVCNHRSLADPVFLSYALQQRVRAITYSVSRLTDILSPIPTVCLTRIRHIDAEIIKSELAKGDLVLCPEGTTCREAFLLRFSSLFAELTDRIVPVAINYRAGLFHAHKARGWKALDIFFFSMNPRPVYEFTFLNQLSFEATCSSGRSPHDVANYVQATLANTLGYECTNFSRKDKYMLLAGNDGTVSRLSVLDSIKTMWSTNKDSSSEQVSDGMSSV